MSEDTAAPDAPRDEPHLLADGSTPRTPDDLFRRFQELDITVRTLEHEPVFTVEEAKAVRGQLDGGHTKNLFLRNKKGKMWLVVCLEDRKVDLKSLASRLGAGRFSFGSAKRLMQHLGVIPGAVTPFGIFNDRTGAVRMVLEKALFTHEVLNFHPLDNARTSTIATADLVRFLEAEEHPPAIIDLG